MGEDSKAWENPNSQGKSKKKQKKKTRALYKMVTLTKQHLSMLVNIQRRESFISIEHRHGKLKKDAVGCTELFYIRP